MSQISGKSVTMQVQKADLDFLSTNGYLSIMPKQDYDQAAADVANLSQMNDALQSERMQEGIVQATLERDERKTHSILFHLEGRDEKEAEIAKIETEKGVVAKEQADMTEKDSKIKELIQKKSAIDRMVPCDGLYVSLTGLGVLTLNDLNVRNYRVSDSDFSDFMEERMETLGELHSIAERGSYQVSNLRTRVPEADFSQLWNVSIGLAKLRADQSQINQRFLLALGVLHHFDSTLDNKMMAAEIITSLSANPSQSSIDNSDLQNLTKTLQSLDHDLRHHAKVPKQISTGVAALVMFGKRYDGTYPTDRFLEFSRMTHSYESAAILSVMSDRIKNELVEKLDPTAKILKTPVQFTHTPSNIFFGYYAPLIIVHSIYYSTFSGIGGFHPAHVHGVGGGGFGG